MSTIHSLQSFIDALQSAGCAVSCTDPGALDRPIRDLGYDSRQLGTDGLFICKGANFRLDYLQAVAPTANAYLSEKAYPVDLPGLIVDDIRQAMAITAAHFYDHPERDLELIAITGTKGKTSTVQILRSILNARAARLAQPPVGLFSTIEIFDGRETIPAQLTTPEAPVVYANLARMRANGLRQVIVEASSQALKYGRLAGLSFRLGLITNITRDHISPIEHPTLEDYVAAKLRLCELSESLIYNVDGEHANEILAALGDPAKARPFRIAGTDAANGQPSLVLEPLKADAKGLCFDLKLSAGPIRYEHLRCPLLGRFNLENIAAACLAALELGASENDLREGLAAVQIEGRMLLQTSHDGLITCLIDFAHNQPSFAAVFASAAELFPKAHKTVLCGTVGGHSENRRQDIGEALAAACAQGQIDEILLSADDPGPETVESICTAIQAALGPYLDRSRIQADRQKAIRELFRAAAARARQGQASLLLLLGRGNQGVMKGPRGPEPYPTDIELAAAELTAYDAGKIN